MQAQQNSMIDQRTQFLQKWLTSASCHQSRDPESFLTQLFHLLQHDSRTLSIFSHNLLCLLQSHQSNLHKIFEYCLTHNTKIFTQQICKFLKICFNFKNQVSLSFALERYLIHNVWREHMRLYVQQAKIGYRDVLEYLSLKMRSLECGVRYEGVCALYDVVEMMGQLNNGQFEKVFRQVFPIMIQKENYGKQVCFSRGVLLQILQDQLCHIKKKGVQLLGKAQIYLDPPTIRPLILYMLNDEHQAVRQACLIVLSQIPNLDIQKQDLSALMVCLKQNNTLMRSYTYENLPHINITSAQDFNLIVQRLYSILPSRSQDKKKIYMVCSRLGRKYPNYVLANLSDIYKYNQSQQPNWKSLVYRARFITVAATGPQKWPKLLPPYFNNHYLYIRDILLSIFEPQTPDTKLLEDLTQQQTQQQPITNQISINLQTDWQLYHYILATQSITQGFLKSVFGLILGWIQNTKFGKQVRKEMEVGMVGEIGRLGVVYNVYEGVIGREVLGRLEGYVRGNRVEELRQLMYMMREQNAWRYLQKIQKIIFKVSNMDKTKIIISNIPQILKRSFIQFSNSSSTTPTNSPPPNIAVGYLRMSQVDFQQVNQKICYFQMNIKCKQIKCFILYGQPMQQYVTQVASLSAGDASWIADLVM